MKYFCPEVVSSESSVRESGSHTESEMSIPEQENESSTSALSSASSNTHSSESQSDSVNDLGYIIQPSMCVAEVSVN